MPLMHVSEDMLVANSNWEWWRRYPLECRVVDRQAVHHPYGEFTFHYIGHSVGLTAYTSHGGWEGQKPRA
jgi:hypothetical protein